MLRVTIAVMAILAASVLAQTSTDVPTTTTAEATTAAPVTTTAAPETTTAAPATTTAAPATTTAAPVTTTAAPAATTTAGPATTAAPGTTVSSGPMTSGAPATTAGPATTGAPVTPPAGTAPPAAMTPPAPWVAQTASAVPAASAARFAYVTAGAATVGAVTFGAWVAYGSTNSINFVNASCAIQSTGALGDANCVVTTVALAYPISSIQALNATAVVVVANSTIAVFNNGAMTWSWTLLGASFDLDSNVDMLSQPLVAMNGTVLYIGSKNLSTVSSSSLMSAVYKLDLMNGGLVWAVWEPYYKSNYQIAWGWIGSAEVIAVRSSYGSTTQIAVISVASGMQWPNVLTWSMWSSDSMILSIAANLVVSYGTRGAYFSNFSTGGAVVNMRDNSASCNDAYTNLMIVNNWFVITACEYYVYYYNLTAIAGFSADGYVSAWGSYSGGNYIKRIILANGTSAILASTLYGLKTISVSATPVATTWWTFPGSNSVSSCEGLQWLSQGAIAVTYHDSDPTISGVYVFNATTGMQLFRYSDNLDPIGAAVLAPTVSPTLGWSFYVAHRGGSGAFGVRALLGFAGGAANTAAGFTNDAGDSDTGSAIFCPINKVFILVGTAYQRLVIYNQDGSTNYSATGSVSASIGVASVYGLVCVAQSSSGSGITCVKLGGATPTAYTSLSVSGSIPYIKGFTTMGSTIYVWSDNGGSYIDGSAAVPTVTRLTPSSTCSGNGIFYMGGASATKVVVPTSYCLDVMSSTGTVSFTYSSLTSDSLTITSNAIVIGSSAFFAGSSTATGFFATDGNLLIRQSLDVNLRVKFDAGSAIGDAGTMKYLVASTDGNTVFAFGSNVSAWSVDGTAHYVTKPPAGMSWIVPQFPSYMYMPTVDTVRGVLIVAFGTYSSTSSDIGAFQGYAVLNMYTGAIYQYLPSVSTVSYTVHNQAEFFNGYFYFTGRSSNCLTQALPASLSNATYDPIAVAKLQRLCWTIDGTSYQMGGAPANTTKGPLVSIWSNNNRNWFDASGVPSAWYANPTWMLTGQFGGSSGSSLLALLEANKKIVIIAVVVVLVVLILLGVIIYCACCRNKPGAGAKEGDSYVSMNTGGAKGV